MLNKRKLYHYPNVWGSWVESEARGNKLSKSTWFLNFEYQVAKVYVVRDSSENLSISSDPWIQLVRIWMVRDTSIFSPLDWDYYPGCLLSTNGPLQVLQLSQLHVKRHTENVHDLSLQMPFFIPENVLPSYLPSIFFH